MESKAVPVHDIKPRRGVEVFFVSYCVAAQRGLLIHEVSR